MCRDPLGDCVAEQVPQQEVTGLTPTQDGVPVPAETPGNTHTDAAESFSKKTGLLQRLVQSSVL